MVEQSSISISVMRGGSSRAVFVSSRDFPDLTATVECETLAKALLGVGDEHQIDGLGGGDLRSSKLAIVGPATRGDADVDYTFLQICVSPAEVQWGINCGNISAAVGPYAIDTGLVEATTPETVVRIHNTNTGKIITATVPVHEGLAAVAGEAVVDGIAARGAPIHLDFTDSAGAVTGKLLPTRRATNRVSVPALGSIELSVVDAGNPVVFIRATDLSLTGAEDPATVNCDRDLLSKLEAIRSAGAHLAGIDPTLGVPLIAYVNAPLSWTNPSTGESYKASSCDILARTYEHYVIHSAYSVSGAVCLGAAVGIPGTIPNQLTRRTSGAIRIGQPAGITVIDAAVTMTGSEPRLERAVITRTARRLLDGTAHVAAHA